MLNIILVAQIGPLLGLAALDLATLNVYLTAFIWLYLLLRVCMPLNKLRAALFGAMVTLFGVAAYLFRDLLQIGTLTLRSLPLFLILAAASPGAVQFGRLGHRPGGGRGACPEGRSAKKCAGQPAKGAWSLMESARPRFQAAGGKRVAHGACSVL